MDSGARRILRSVKLCWNTYLQDIQVTAPRADLCNNCGLSRVQCHHLGAEHCIPLPQGADGETVSAARGGEHGGFLGPSSQVSSDPKAFGQRLKQNQQTKQQQQNT